MGFETELFIQQSIDRNLLCNICHAVLEKPTAVCKNSHTFCADCIETWEKRSNECPDCRAPITNKLRILPLQNLILAMNIKCPEKARGENDETNKRARQEGAEDVSESQCNDECCGWQGSLSDYVEKHRSKECMFRSVECPLGCKKMIRVLELESHKTGDCEHQIVKCSLCNKKIRQHKLQGHEIYRCPEARTSCKYCGMRMLRKLLGTKPDNTDWNTASDDLPRGQSTVANFSGHYKVCHKMPVKCDFFDAGCHVLVKRGDLEGHHARHGRKHAQLVASKMKQMRKDMEKHSKEIEWQLPVSDLREACHERRFIRETQRVRVGAYQAFIRLTVNSGEVCMFVGVDNPDPESVPTIDNIFIEAENIAEVKMCEEQRMEKDGGNNNTCSMGGTLQFPDDDDNFCSATLEDLIRWSDGSTLDISASFRLKSPKFVSLRSTTSSNMQGEEFWSSLESRRNGRFS